MSQSATLPGRPQRARKKDGETYLGALDARCIFLRHEALVAAVAGGRRVLLARHGYWFGCLFVCFGGLESGKL
jgi:hypothetical protein